MTERILLIDADVVAYVAASSVEVAMDWGEGYWTWHCDEQEVKDACDYAINTYKADLWADKVMLCLTDSERNFRLDVLPTYKGMRASVKKPLMLKHIKQWMIDERGAVFRPRLEGDDCMGILATNPKLKGEKIIVSIDKDMKTIPGLYYRDAETGLQTITPEYADQFHMMQTLAGDITDGYSGCPGVGMVTAEKHITELLKVEAYEHELKSGKRKGETETRYRHTPADTMWEVVVSFFESAGLTEADALVQARVARILRSSDYNYQTKEPILWTPPS